MDGHYFMKKFIGKSLVDRKGMLPLFQRDKLQVFSRANTVSYVLIEDQLISGRCMRNDTTYRVG